MDNIIIYLNARTNLYNTISNFFYKEPTKADYDQLKQYAPVIKEIATQASVDVEKAYDTFMGYSWDDKSEDTLAKEFASIYLVSDVHNRIKPVVVHESVYLSLSGLTMQDERDHVMEKFYRQGFKKQDGFTEPEDHIKAELDFISVMTSRLVKSINEENTEEAKTNIAAQNEFTSEHLSRWYKKACDDIAKRSRSDYFRGLSELISIYITADLAIFNELSESIVN